MNSTQDSERKVHISKPSMKIGDTSKNSQQHWKKFSKENWINQIKPSLESKTIGLKNLYK